MANNYSAQGSITIKRLRNGDTIFLTLENSIPLYQGVSPESGAVKPDWSNTNNQPVIMPKANTTRNIAVSLSNHHWFYNNSSVPINFSGTGSGEWMESSDGKFAINSNTGALKIIANLASQTNIANDVLTYEATATVAGVEYVVRKSIDIIIQQFGAASYHGTVTASTEQLTSTETEAILTTQLYLSGEEVSNYYVKWYKDNEEWTENNGKKVIEIGRDNVDGTQLFIAEFYRSAGDTSSVFRAATRITDTLDEFQIILSITSQNKEVSPGNGVTVQAKIINQRTGGEVDLTNTNPAWEISVMKKSNWATIRSVNAATITVTTQDTDDVDGENDVEVTAECNWQD